MAKITNERTQAFRKAFEQNSKQIALQRGVVKMVFGPLRKIFRHMWKIRRSSPLIWLQEKSQTKNNLDAAGCLRH